MVRQSDLVDSKSLEECGSHGNTDDDFEEYSEEEMPSEEESNENLHKLPNKEGSSDEESAEEASCGEGCDDEDSCAEEPNEEDSDEEPDAAFKGTTLEEASDEDPTEVLSFEEIIEEELTDESEEEPNGEETLRGSLDQLPLVTVRDEVPSLLKEKKISDHIFSESKTSADSSGCQYLRESSNLSTDAIVSQQREPDVQLASSKKRRSRWDIKAPMLVNDSGESGDLVKRRKTRWSSDETQLNMSCTLKLPDSLKDILSGSCNDPHIQRLNRKLQVIHQKLEGGVMVNEQPEEESTPSPLPIDDGLDTKDSRHRLYLLKQKRKVISELFRKSGKNVKPRRRADFYTIFCKKLYVPVKEYPNYNFAGLIIGPKGNTLKKMEKMTEATIRLRGKGSNIKSKRSSAPDDDLHVLIQSDSQTSFDAAVSMVEKLLIPVDDSNADQIRELAEIRGTLNEREMEPCDICGKTDHPTSDCPLTATTSQSNTGFHTGSGSLFSSFKPPSPFPCSVPVVAKAYSERPKREIDPTNLYVGYLPQSLSSDKLRELFLPYGSPCKATVMVDKIGQSKGYGFVNYTTTSAAAQAIEKMNGYMIDGKKLAVKVAGIFPPPLNANLPNHPQLASIPPSSLNANLLQFYPGLSVISFPSSSNAILPNYLGLSSILPPSSSNANMQNYPGVSSTPHPSSLNANLLNYPGLAAIPREIPELKFGSILPESGISFPKGSSNSFTGMPPLSSNANLPHYPLTENHRQSLNANPPNNPGFAAIPRDIPEPNYWPGPPGSILPESGTYFAKSSHSIPRDIPERNCWPGPPGSILPESGTYFPKSSHSIPWRSSSAYLGVTTATNELDSFPGYLKSIDSSDQFDQLMPPSSLSSQPAHFIRSFSGSQMNPTWQ